MKRSSAIGNACALALLALNVAIVLYGVDALPATIATHFGPDGVGYGSKDTLLLLIPPPLLVYALLYAVDFLPLRWMNLPMLTLTPQNEGRVRDTVRAMFAWIRVCVGGTFALLSFAAVQSAAGSPSPIFVAIVFSVIPLGGVLVYFLGALARIGP
ncbi:MAG: DUF1648 domain-containing protein [bacterium]|nr:DUF1648 domain-containing protein [bacterium]